MIIFIWFDQCAPLTFEIHVFFRWPPKSGLTSFQTSSSDALQSSSAINMSEGKAYNARSC